MSGILTGPRASVIRSSFLGSAIRCSRTRKMVAGVPSIVMVHADYGSYGGSGPIPLSDMSGFAYPDMVSGLVRRWNFSAAAEHGDPAEWTLTKGGDGHLKWAYIPPHTYGYGTPQAPFVIDSDTYPWNPRVSWHSGDGAQNAWREKLKVYGPCAGTVIQFSSLIAPGGWIVFWNDADMIDPVIWEAYGFGPVSITGLTVAAGATYELICSETPAYDPVREPWTTTPSNATFAMLFPGTTPDDFPPIPEGMGPSAGSGLTEDPAPSTEE